MTEKNIEKLVVERKTQLARRSIFKWVKKHSASPRVVYQACQWLRRLSLYREGLRLLLNDKLVTFKKDYRYNLWLAEYFHLLGATHFARHYAHQIKGLIKDVYELDVAARIFLGLGEFHVSIDIYRRVLDFHLDRESHFYQMAQIGLADALARIGQYGKALKIVLSLETETNHEIIRTIAKSARGEYYARRGQYARAVKLLKTIQFSKSDRTYDRALVWKWLGYAYGKNGDRKNGQRFLRQALNVFEGSGMGLDELLENMELLVELKWLSKKDQVRFSILASHIYGSKLALVSAQIGTPRAMYCIYLSSREFYFSNRLYYDLPKEVELLGLLRLAEQDGLGFEVVKGVLWSQDFHSYLYLDQRIFLLVNRLKKFKFDIQIVSRKIYLASSEFAKVSVFYSLDPRPGFLRSRRRFAGVDVSQCYECGHNQRSLYLKNWLASGWIKKISKGMYEVI